MKKVIIGLGKDNVEVLDMTSEEIAQAESDKEIAIAKKAEEDAAKTNHENLKASAKTKLMAGEPLTEEEASLMIGG
tara:strand:+ start:823 stop:1050 length:228 start_codon:yes stop_codon:yes gene_type:complete